MQLSDIVAELGRAGAKAVQMVSAYQEMLLENSFDRDEKGVLQPKMVQLEISPGVLINVPRYALKRTRGIDMERLSFEFDATVSLNEKDNPGDGESEVLNETIPAETVVPASRIDMTLKKGLFTRQSHMKVKVSFLMDDPPEATEVLRDKFNEMLRNQLEG